MPDEKQPLVWDVPGLIRIEIGREILPKHIVFFQRVFAFVTEVSGEIAEENARSLLECDPIYLGM